MIKLDCPQCQRQLEIDDGFAGGVCRCFGCGTLMTVPAAGEHAERLTRTSAPSDRPDRPDRPDTPDSSAGARKRPTAPAPASASAKADDAEVFVTSTGRTIRLSRDQFSHVATARKPRMGLRIGIIAGFIVFVIAIAVAMGILFVKVQGEQQKEQQGVQQQAAVEKSVDLSKEVLSYDPAANPLILTTPNILGVPVPPEKQTLILLIDSSLAMRDYINFICGVVEANIKTLPADVTVQAVFTDEAGLHVIPTAPAPAGQWNQSDLKLMLDALNPQGIQKLPEGMDKALAAKPDRIVLVTSMAPVKPVMDKLAGALDASPAVICDIFQLGRTNEALQQLAENHKGHYYNLPDGQITSWYAEFQRGK